jgi:Dolichyl-phosphate-mannose-protein mannosyltransferase
MSSPQKPGLLIPATVGLFALVVLFHLASARAGYPHFRDLHLGTALEYAKGNIDLLRPMVVGFNASDTPTPQEVPIWQALAALVFKTFGPWWGWANLLSLALFATGLWPLWQLARTPLGERGAWWTLLFFLAQPLLVMMSGQASGDGLSLVLSIWFLYFAERMIRSGSAAWLPAALVFGALSATTKLPLFMAAGLASFFLLLLHARGSAKTWTLLIAAGVGSGVIFALWTRYAGGVVKTALFPYVELWSWASVSDWYFGSMAYRLNPVNWAKGGWAAMNCLFGSLALGALAGWALLFSRNRLAQFWFVAALCTTLVFTHVVLVHRHYYILFSPAVALLGASAALRLEELLDLRKGWQRATATAFALAVLGLSIAQGLLGIEVTLNYDTYPARIAALMRQHTAPEEKLLVWGGNWGGEYFLRSERRGLSIRSARHLDDPADFARLLSLGYTKLVMISESPLLTALQKTNPGGADQARYTWRAELPAAASQWETIVESEDLLIKKLPARAE